MELFIISLGFISLLTTIVAIDESINWMAHYRREGEEDHRERQTLSYDQLTEQGYRE